MKFDRLNAATLTFTILNDQIDKKTKSTKIKASYLALVLITGFYSLFEDELLNRSMRNCSDVVNNHLMDLSLTQQEPMSNQGC